MTQPLGVFDYTNQQYHASEGLSRSRLWTFKQLPSKYHYEYLSGQYVRPTDSDAFVLGDLVHTMFLEPHLVVDKFINVPMIDKRTKAGKELWAEFLLQAAGKQLVKTDIYNQAESMYQSLCSSDTAHDLVSDAKMEKSIYWKHEATGLICKARPDVWKGRIVSDLKTTQDAGFRGFQMSAFKYGYFLQAAMIYEALKSIDEPFQNFVFICVEKSAPYAMALYMLDDDALQFGIDMFHNLMQDIAKAYETNVWPGYGIQKLTIPKYATMEVQGEQN